MKTKTLIITGPLLFSLLSKADDKSMKMPKEKMEACMKDGKSMEQCAQMNNMSCSMMNEKMNCEMMKDMHQGMMGGEGGMMGKGMSGKGTPQALEKPKDPKKPKTVHNHETHKDEPVKEEEKKN